MSPADAEALRLLSEADDGRPEFESQAEFDKETARVDAFCNAGWREAARFMREGNFISREQHAVMLANTKGEEGEFFRHLFVEFANRINAMPSTGETDGQMYEAVAHLKYFAGGRASFYITERDKGCADDGPEDRQSQAFGLSDLFGDGGELGYISLPEIFSCRGELDLYWTPKTLAEVRL